MRFWGAGLSGSSDGSSPAIMTLIPTSGENQVFYNDVTNQNHLVNINPADGTKTDLGVIAQADQLTALASLETQVDFTTDAVDLTTAAVVLNTTSVDLVTTAVASLETQVDFITVSTDLISTNLLARNAIDPASNARIAITNSHSKIHSGDSFNVNDVINVNSTTQRWLVTAPNATKWAHMVFDIRCTGEMSVVITEAATHTGTTGLTELNRNRNSVTAAGTTVHRGIATVSPATSDGTTVVDSSRVGATGQGNKTISPGADRGGSEIILKQDTKYTVAVETFADVYVTLHLDWYENTSIA